jgi:hypothetical protein
MQEAMILSMVKEYVKEGADAGRIAAAIHLGKRQSELTEADLRAHPMQRLMRAARTYKEIAKGIKDSNEGEDLSWNFTGTDKEIRFAKIARSVALCLNKHGWCKEGARDTFWQALHIRLGGSTAWHAKDTLEMLVNKGILKRVSANEPKEVGMIKVIKPQHTNMTDAQISNLPEGMKGKLGAGHIAILGPNGMEYSDHVQKTFYGPAHGYGNEEFWYRLADV